MAMAPTEQDELVSSSHAAFCAALREWQPLLQPLLHPPSSSSSPVGAAVHWVRGHGFPCALGTASRTRANLGSLPSRLWRLVPDLLALRVPISTPREGPVVVDPPEEAKRKKPAVGSCMWIETLPSVVQANILSFLSVEHTLFRSKDLELLALNMLSSSELNFWVVRAVQNLLSKVSRSRTAIQESKHVYSDVMGDDILPEWLQDDRYPDTPVLPWLPIQTSTVKRLRGFSSGIAEVRLDKTESESKLNLEKGLRPDTQGNRNEISENEVMDLKTPTCISEGFLRENVPSKTLSSPSLDGSKYTTLNDIQESCLNAIVVESEIKGAPDDSGVSWEGGYSPNLYSRAEELRDSWLVMEPSVQDVDSLRAMADPTALLKLIKPWEMGDDDMVRVIEPLLRKEDGYLWSAQILSYFILPKLVSLELPASRVLVSAVLQASKFHPRAAVDALLVPLVLCDGGPNTSQCDVINRTVKESLPDHHVLSFCGKIFLQGRRQRLPFSLPPSAPHNIFDSSLMWTEPVCTVVHNILSRPVLLDEEILDGLMNDFGQVVNQFTKSLKFSNLLLCLIVNYGPYLKQHKSMLRRVAEKTDTFMTKSLLSKSSAL